MSYKIIVTFEFVHNVGGASIYQQIGGMEDLQEIAAKPNIVPQSGELIRKVSIVNMDKTQRHILNSVPSYNGHPVETSFEDGKFKFMFPILWYAGDVNKYLTERYGSVLNFNPSEESLDKPISFHVFHNNSIGLRNPKTGAPTEQVWRSVSWRYLGDFDVVVDANLNQIWPVATGKPPVALVELLNKTTEISR